MRQVKVIKRSNKLISALQLPKIVNVYPRSIMNKINEFKTFIEEENPLKT